MGQEKEASFNLNLASFPGLPLFFVLRFVFNIIHGSGRHSEKRGLPGSEITSNATSRASPFSLCLPFPCNILNAN